jgi:DNA-binding CsgD family transcriptional regulator
MKGSSALVGRDAELAALEVEGRGGTLVALIGERGSGRTTLLAGAAAAARAAGRVALCVDLGTHRPDWDEYGVGPLLDAVTAQFEDLGAGTDLVQCTAALRRRCAAGSYRTAAGRAAVHAEIHRLLACLGPDVAVVLLDDADLVTSPEYLALAAREAGHRVVATTTRRTSLSGVADQLVRLAPLGIGDIERLLRRALRHRPDAWLTESLRRALGPLSGNPSYVLSMIEELRRSDRLVTVAGRVCLRHTHRTPTLPIDSPALAAVSSPDGFAEDLVVLVDGAARIRVDDVPLVAVALGRPVPETGRVVDRLVEQMILAEHDGALVVCCPAVGATLRQRASVRRVREVHAAVALAATDPVNGHLAPLDHSVLADHVAAAGEALAPDPRWAELLRRQACVVEHRGPDRAARFLLAVCRHGIVDDERARTTEWAIRLLLRAGDHEGVVGLVNRVVGAGGHEPATPGGVDRQLLAAAAAVAALTLHQPVPAAVQAALAEEDDATCPLRLVQRWADGESLDADGLMQALAVLAAPSRFARRRRSEALRAAESALTTRDIVGALEQLLAPAYTRPRSGPLVLLNKVLAAYRSGRWDEASAGARAIFADHGSDTDAAPLREVAALIAVDIAICRGDDRVVEVWQELLPDRATDSLHPLVHAMVEATRLWISGDGAAALAHGLRIWEDTGPEMPAVGRRCLLTRLCGIATADGRRELRPRLLDAAIAWRRHARGADATAAAQTWDLLRGVLGEPDPAGRAILARAVEPVRSIGCRAELAWVLLAVGAAAPDPETSWSEMHRIAKELEAPVLRSRMRRLMDEHGVRLSVNRSRDPGLTDVQLRILELVEQGMTNRQIARHVRMSEKTVENHLTRLFVRFGCRTRHGLATARLTARRDQLRVGA